MKKILIKNADWVITMNSERQRIKNGDILIEGSEILAVGKNLQVTDPVDEIIDGRGRIATPGFVNTHHHCWQSLVRNIHVANGLKLEPWLQIVYDIFQGINNDVVESGIYVGLGDLLKSGCTTSNDHHYAHPRGAEHLIDTEIETAKKLGIRFHPTRGSLSIGKSKGSPHVPDSIAQSVREILDDSERLIKSYHDPERFAMTRIGLAPGWHGLDSTEEVLDGTKSLAEKYDVQCHSHLCESKGEVEATISKFGCRPVEFLEKHGWLGENFYYAHCVQLSDEEVKVMASTGTGIAHCPISNMFLNSGVCRVPDLLARNAAIGIGVDGAASNNASNMMTEIRTAYLVHRLAWGDNAPSAEQILEIATIGGARVLGRDDIGSLAPGMAADIVLFNWDQLEFAGGRNDPVSCIVLSGNSKMVDRVLVNGKLVVKGGDLLNIDEQEMNRKVEIYGKQLIGSALTRIPDLEQDM